MGQAVHMFIDTQRMTSNCLRNKMGNTQAHVERFSCTFSYSISNPFNILGFWISFFLFLICSVVLCVVIFLTADERIKYCPDVFYVRGFYC